MSASADYRVALDVYNGPLDLLLFLIKRDEVDIYDIPISHITEQYLEYVRLIEHLDPEAAGTFLVLAATLMEIKSRTLLPKPPIAEDDEEMADPRLELVRQLLEYKKFKDAARTLDHRAEEHARKFPRKPVLPEMEEEEYELENLDVWNLFEAFNALLKQIGGGEYKHYVGVDDTPITLHAEDILDSLERAGGRQQFSEVFGGRDRGEMIGLFLALLELIRQRRVGATQERPFAAIDIVRIDRTPLDRVPSFDASEDADAEELPAFEPAMPVSDLDDDTSDASSSDPARGDDELDEIERTLSRMETEEAAASRGREAHEDASVDDPANGDGSNGDPATEAGGPIVSRPKDSIPVNAGPHGAQPAAAAPEEPEDDETHPAKIRSDAGQLEEPMHETQ